MLVSKSSKVEQNNMNGAIYLFCLILKLVVVSAAESELGDLLLNSKEGKIPRILLKELGHKQPPTLIHCDNVSASDIENDTTKKQIFRSI